MARERPRRSRRRSFLAARRCASIHRVRQAERSGGWFAWSIIHPAFPGIHEIRASWPSGGNYFDEGWWNTGGEGVRGRVGSNHRTFSTYLNAMLAHGFALEASTELAAESIRSSYAVLPRDVLAPGTTA